ncbi:MAG: S8 family peptidase [Clostridia bacterium]|nr:S8 family peptidase [Clostridia bacterium]
MLNLSLDVSPSEREQSAILKTGYSEETQTWEVIARFHGKLDFLEEESVLVEDLSGGYAILTVPESHLRTISTLEEIEYIEKPRRLFFEQIEEQRISCISSLYGESVNLHGSGVLLAVLDSGIDYSHPAFLDDSGMSRILALWDQSIEGGSRFSPPDGFYTGAEFTKADIDEALRQSDIQARLQIVPSVDVNGHGTAVAGIAAGSRTQTNPTYAGVADQSDLLVVKLGTAREGSYPRTVELMRGLYYVLQKSIQLGRPLVINLSFGHTYGSHQGNSLLEEYLNYISGIWKTVICIGSGNEGAAGGHYAGTILDSDLTVELAVGEFENGLNIQIWKHYGDEFLITLITPRGRRITLPEGLTGTWRYPISDVELFAYIGEPSPYAQLQEIFLDFIPSETFMESGIWSIEFKPRRIQYGQFHMYLPSESVLSAGTRFFNASPMRTLTIPSAAFSPITVGAYNSVFRSYAEFSGRGGESCETIGYVKPELVAPGVNITAPKVGGGYEAFTGTSFATPFVSGGAALLMEWGIVKGNDPYLYGQKVKAYLRRGARQLPGMETPNPMTGWGALCVADSLPR